MESFLLCHNGQRQEQRPGACLYRSRSNLINWGMLPFVIPEGALPFQNLDYLFLPDIRKAVEEKQSEITAYVVKGSELKEFKLGLGAMTDDEREIILKGCLINYYRG